LPVSEPPPSVSFTEAFAAAGDAYRQSQAEPGTPLAHENSVDWVDSGRAADPATLRAALSTFPGATTVTGFNFQHQDLEEEDESEQHRGRTAFIVVAVLLVLAAAGFGFWRYMLKEANKPIAKLTPACTSGDGRACYDLAALNEQDKAASDGAVRATAFYAQACELNFPLACRKLGLKYLFGTGVAVDTQKAIDLFGKGCDKADIESCDNLADLYHEGKGVPMDDAKAAEIYNKACTAGDQVGCTWAKRLATPPPPVKRIPKRVAPADADSDSAQ
jgi:TPR repeat protein